MTAQMDEEKWWLWWWWRELGEIRRRSRTRNVEYTERGLGGLVPSVDFPELDRRTIPISILDHAPPRCILC